MAEPAKIFIRKQIKLGYTTANIANAIKKQDLAGNELVDRHVVRYEKSKLIKKTMYQH